MIIVIVRLFIGLKGYRKDREDSIFYNKIVHEDLWTNFQVVPDSISKIAFLNLNVFLPLRDGLQIIQLPFTGQMEQVVKIVLVVLFFKPPVVP